MLSSVTEGEKKGRSYQEVEVYSKLFFEGRIREAISEKLAVTGAELGRMDIQCIKDETHTLYLAEPEEVKQQVREFAKTRKQDAKQQGTSVPGAKETWASPNGVKLVMCVCYTDASTYIVCQKH